jgi:hypothetical protein
MLGVRASKKDYIYTGKWLDNDDRENTSFFRFGIAGSKLAFKKAYGNMDGLEGSLTIKTQSGLNFKVKDTIFWNGERFRVLQVDENYKIDEERAFYRVRSKNGMLEKIITLRRL